jgi:hypothetical protein
MNKKELRAAVVFAILMENNGIVSKSPGYILEKLKSTKSYDEPECLLDNNNMQKFNAWKAVWKVDFTEEGVALR